MNASSGATNGIARINEPWRCMMRQSDKWNEVSPNDATMHSHLDNNKHRNEVAWLNASTRTDDRPHPAQFKPATTPANLVVPRMHLQLNVSLGGKAQPPQSLHWCKPQSLRKAAIVVRVGRRLRQPPLTLLR